MDANRLYQDLAWLWPLWGDPDGDYAEWCARVTALMRQHARRETRTLLNMGCGGGKNTYNLYLIREDGKLRIEPDYHRLGLFPLDVWRATLRAVGFEVYEDADPDRIGGMTFVCVKP